MPTTRDRLLLVSSSNGIYIPKMFVENYEQTITNREQLQKVIDEVKKGPDYVDYFEAWEEIVCCATLNINGKSMVIEEDDDLWAAPNDEEDDYDED